MQQDKDLLQQRNQLRRRARSKRRARARLDQSNSTVTVRTHAAEQPQDVVTVRAVSIGVVHQGAMDWENFVDHSAAPSHRLRALPCFGTRAANQAVEHLTPRGSEGGKL